MSRLKCVIAIDFEPDIAVDCLVLWLLRCIVFVTFKQYE